MYLLTFDINIMGFQWGEKNLFGKWFWNNWKTKLDKMNLNHYFTLHINFNSLWNTDLMEKLKF